MTIKLTPKQESDIAMLGRFTQKEYGRYRQNGAIHSQALKLAKFATDGNGHTLLIKKEREVLDLVVTA